MSSPDPPVSGCIAQWLVGRFQQSPRHDASVDGYWEQKRLNLRYPGNTHFLYSWIVCKYKKNKYIHSDKPSFVAKTITNLSNQPRFLMAFVDLLIHWSSDSLNPWIIGWFNELSMDSFISLPSQPPFSFVDAPHSLNSALLLHRKNFPLDHWCIAAISYFRDFLPGACRALSGIIKVHF